MNKQQARFVAKTPVEKSKGMRIVGIAVGALSLAAAVVGFVFFLTTGTFGTLFTDIFNGTNVLFNSIFILSFLGIVVYLIMCFLKAFKKDTLLSGNRFVGLTMGLATFFYILCVDFERAYTVDAMFIGMKGIRVFRYLIMHALFFYLIYNIVEVIFAYKKVEKCGKKPYLIAGLAIGAEVVVAVFCAFLFTVGGSGYGVAGLYNEASSSDFINAFKDISTIGFGGFLVNILKICFTVEAGRWLATVIFDVCKLSFDENYYKVSSYFWKSSPFFSAVRLAIFPLIIDLAGGTFSIINLLGFIAVAAIAAVYQIFVIKANKAENKAAESNPANEEVKEETEEKTEDEKPEETPAEEIKEEPEEKEEEQQEVAAAEEVKEETEEKAEEEKPEETSAEEIKEEPVEEKEEVLDTARNVAAEAGSAGDAVDLNGKSLVGFDNSKLSMQEKLKELTEEERKLYRQAMLYAYSKPNVKRNTNATADTVVLGRRTIIKAQIKRGKIICMFDLSDANIKKALKGTGIKESMTVAKLTNEKSLEAVKHSIDMAYDIAVASGAGKKTGKKSSGK